ncbi:MAG: UvrD-helicase domain-containing protein, partial [Treponema sp.]|nr:UvrD-helicase domain-containing protein [Treponema sp.]
MKDFLSYLNDEQKQASTTTEGHIRVLAGAGTGKTRALTSRYCYLARDL